MMKDTIKRMRTAILAGAVLMAPFATAQEGGRSEQKDPEVRAKERTERMTQELGLSAEQAERIQAIHMAHAERHKAMRDMEDAEARREAMKETRQAMRKAMDEVLTPEQLEKAKALRAEKDGKGGKGRWDKDPEAMAEARTLRMTEALGLDAAQATRIKAIHVQHLTKMEEARAREDEAERKTAMQEIMRSQREGIRGVLTPEQQERWKEMQAARKAGMEKRGAKGRVKERK